MLLSKDTILNKRINNIYAYLVFKRLKKAHEKFGLGTWCTKYSFIES